MKISLVIPVKNEERSIERLLATISAQTRPPDEVVIVDAGSTDRTREIIDSCRDDKIRLKVLSMGPAYPGTARNEGVRNASHDIIAFTDCGIELDKDWVKELESTMQDDGSCDVVYGNYAPDADTFFKKCLSAAVVPPSSQNSKGRQRPRFIASSILKKRVWSAVGGFPDLRAAEDRIFMEAVEREGFNVCRNPRAMVVWRLPENARRTFERFRSYSYHDLMAGRWHDWHLPVLKMYTAALLFLGLGLVVRPIFLYLPLLGLIARTMRKVFINRDEPYLKAVNMPMCLFYTGFIILLVDAALFSGWIKYIIERRR